MSNWIVNFWSIIALQGFCPEENTKLVGATCVDRWEAPNEVGVNPLMMKSAYDGEAWCQERGKRLCSMDEWVQACEGTPIQVPLEHHGRVEAPGICNNDKPWLRYDEDKFNSPKPEVYLPEALKVWQGSRSGDHPECVSYTGVEDLIGNVEEWVTSPSDKFGYALMGHYWSRTADSCTDRVSVHAPRFYYYETGFRCCSKPHYEIEVVVRDDNFIGIMLPVLESLRAQIEQEQSGPTARLDQNW